MSRGALKLLAILLMAGNHIAQVFLSPNTVSYHLRLGTAWKRFGKVGICKVEPC